MKVLILKLTYTISRNTNISRMSTAEIILAIFQVQTNKLPVTKFHNTKFDNIPKTHAEVLLRMWLYLENGLHVWADESGGIRHQVTQHAGTLLFVSAHTAMFQLCQDLDKVILYWTVPSLALFNCITTDTFIPEVWQNN